MRPVLLLALLLLTMLTAGSSATTAPGDGPNARRWQQIDALLKKDQTTSAAKLVEEIYQRARQRQEAPEYLRALLYKLRLLEAKEEEADEKAIALVEADLKTARFPARPMLHSLLAQLYATYYQHHRYQLYDRTRAADADTTATDVRTWDAARLAGAIVHHYRSSLTDEPQRQQQLQLTKLGYAIRGGDAAGRTRRPTLYDLLAHRAIDGLGNDEYYLTAPAEQFELRDAALFGPAADFARLALTAPLADSLNGQLHALQVLRQLTAFRLADTQNRPALADVDLKRLRFVHQHTVLAQKDSLYRAALARLATAYETLPVTTEFLLAQADNLAETAPASARLLALQAENRFPTSYGAQQARALRQRLEAVELSFTLEDVGLPNQPWLLQLRVRNVTRLYAKAYRVSNAYRLRLSAADAPNEKQDFQKALARILASQPAAAWTLDIPGPADYKSHTVQQAGPALPLGYYLVVLSTTATDPTKERPGVTSARDFLSISELSQVRRQAAAGGGTDLLVVHRQSGMPRSAVQVLPLFEYYDAQARRHKQRRGAALLTNAEGIAHIPAVEKPEVNGQLRAVVLTQGQDSLLAENIGGYYPTRNRVAGQPQRRTFLYTDRAIYRPGQTLYFKGILTESQAGQARLLTRQAVSVRLVDVNGQTVQALPFITSDFGSFHGSVVLPVGLLTGEMSLQTDDGRLGFAVEDYKRPTFRVTFEPVPGTPLLGQELTVRGQATAYAGQPIDGATVQYRVVRRSFWPMAGRGYGGFLPGRNAEVEILHGTAQTDSAGGFVVKFRAAGEAVAGPRPRGTWPPGYVFAVTADVTDAGGETHTGEQSISLGTNALTLQLEVEAQLDREHLPPLRLLSTNATGTASPARGTLQLYRLTPPVRALRPRAWERPEREALGREEFKRRFPLDAYGAEDNDSTWSRTLVLSQDFDTEATPLLPALAASLARQAPGRYVLTATVPATTSRPAVVAEQAFTLFSAAATTLPVPTADWFVSLQDSVAPGQPARFLVGSAEAGARLLFEAEAQGQTLHHQWLTLAAGEQRVVEVPAAALGETQLYVHLTQVRDNRLYTHLAAVQVATPPAPLRLSIDTFRDKLQPGQSETWRVTIHQANGQPAAAELLATLYDQSLDVLRPHSFAELAFPNRYAYYPALNWNGHFGTSTAEPVSRVVVEDDLAVGPLYPGIQTWGYNQLLNPYEIPGMNTGRVPAIGGVMRVAQALQSRAAGVNISASNAEGKSVVIRENSSLPAPMAGSLDEVVVVGYGTQKRSEMTGSVATTAQTTQPDLSAVQARADFRETAFWLPALRTNAQGETVLEFQMPEAVTRWQLLALAHDQQLHTGLLRRELVTQKQLQVTPNAPRFFHEGDQLRLTARLSNLTGQPLSGTAQLFLFDARTQQPLDSRLLKSTGQLKFDLPANASRALGWALAIPEAAAGQVPLEAITYRVVALSEPPKAKKRKPEAQLSSFSDGEENTLPVLSNRLLVTEALPLAMVGPGTRTFELQKLTAPASPTRRNYALTLEMSPNPAWYAVQALPYLMEYPYECSEQVFSRLYANLLAARILQQTPRLRPVLAEWQRAAQGGDKQALASKLEQNQELKALRLQETPWVRDGQSDTDRMRRLAELFDEPRLRAETARALTRLAAMQLPDGAFPWFDKMPADRYITQLIVAGLGKLQKLNAYDVAQSEQARQVLSKALAYLDGQLQRDYADLQKGRSNLKENHLSDSQIQALYARSFWPKQAVTKAAQPAAAYYAGQLATFWPQQNRYLQGLSALALHRTGNSGVARQIMTALAENALHSPELGMYWKEVRGGYYWREAPTETQATLIEAFDEVANEQPAVEEMKLWLLQQKQTQHWESTRATADACYALLLRGSDWLQPAPAPQVTLGGVAVPPTAQQAGTGYFKLTFPAAEIKPAQGHVTVTQATAGMAWGGLYWQYFEQIDKLTPAATGLQLERRLYREQRTAGGPVLVPLTAAAPLRVGDVLVVRLVLRTDRDLEYVHLKDQRAAGLALISQTSGYRYQGGLGYYESPRDAATNFFIGALPKGTHTFEYRLRAAQSGDFSGGLSQLQCLYAPEFVSHSAGTRLQIEP